MVDSFALILGISYLVHAVVSAVAGYAIARRSGRPVVLPVLLCAALPWLGVVVLAAAGRMRLPTQRGPRTRTRTGGAVLLALSGLVVWTSILDDWAEVAGNADKYRESISGGPGNSGSATFVVLALGALLIGAAVLGWMHGGLRYAIPTAWLAATVASLLVSAVMVSDVLNELAGSVETFSAGQARATLDVGVGAWLGLAGSMVATAGAIALLLAAASSGAPAVSTARGARMSGQAEGIAAAESTVAAGSTAATADPWASQASSPDPWASQPVPTDPWADQTGGNGISWESAPSATRNNSGTTSEGW